MLAKMIQPITRCYIILSSLFFALSSDAQEVVYIEAGNQVVFEVENHALVAPWTIESSESGFLGTGYIRGGEDYFGPPENPGQGVLSFRIQIQN